MKQQTLANSGELSGPTVYSNDESTIVLHPARENYGIEFWTGNAKIPAQFTYVDRNVAKWTTLTKGGHSVHTVEHLMSALFGMGIQNAIIEVRGAGVPVLDGSAAPFVRLIEDLGIEEQGASVHHYRVEPRYVFETMIDYGTGKLMDHMRSFIIGYPYHELQVSYSMDYPTTPIGAQLVSYAITPDIYAARICEARTFMTKWEIERWRGWLLSDYFCENVLTVTSTRSFAERIPNEAATHKVLDFIGDLALWIGSPQLRIAGAFSLFRSGHSLNKKLMEVGLWSSSS